MGEDRIAGIEDPLAIARGIRNALLIELAAAVLIAAVALGAIGLLRWRRQARPIEAVFTDATTGEARRVELVHPVGALPADADGVRYRTTWPKAYPGRTVPEGE